MSIKRAARLTCVLEKQRVRYEHRRERKELVDERSEGVVLEQRVARSSTHPGSMAAATGVLCTGRAAHVRLHANCLLLGTSRI